jgi:hypothetical protein
MITSLFIVIGLLLQIDDERVPALTGIIDATEIAGESDAYLYLLAIDSANNNKLTEQGRAILQQAQQVDANKTLNNTALQASAVASEYTKLVLVTNDLLCAYSQSSCLAYVFNNIDKIPSVLQGSELIIERYQTYLSYNDFKTLSEPLLSESIPPYQFMIRAARLINLKQLLAFSPAEQVIAVQALYDHHSALRAQLILQDTLLGKLVILSLLSENIDFLSLFSAQFKVTVKEPLQALTIQERSLRSGFNREIKMMSNMLEALDGAPDIFKQQGVDEVSVPSWLTHILFKKNMTLNESYKLLDYYAMLSEMSVAKFEDEMLKNQLKPTIEKHWLRNPIGTILNQIATPDYSFYISHFWDMDNKIRLYNMHINQTLHVTATINSVYQRGEQALAYFKDDNNSWCFDSPYQQQAKYNCLAVGVNRK